MTVPHRTSAPGGDFGVGRGLNARKASIQGELPTPSHQVGNCARPGLGRWEMELCAASPTRLLQLETHPGGKGRTGILFPVLWVSPREQEHGWIHWENPAQVWDPRPCFEIPGAPLGAGGFIIFRRKMLLNFVVGRLRGCKCHFFLKKKKAVFYVFPVGSPF